MTDAEIIEALEICLQLGSGCSLCPLLEETHCYDHLLSEVLDLYNRQKAEIEKFEKVEHFATETIRKQAAEIEKSEKEFNDKFNSLVASNVYLINRVDKARTEAIKEFWNELKQKKQWDVDIPDYIFVADGDNLVKEMTE